MIHLKNGEVNVGDKIIATIKNKKLIGTFESIYNGNINFRDSKSKDLFTIPFNDALKAEPDVIIKLTEEEEKEELLSKLNSITHDLSKYGIYVRIERNQPKSTTAIASGKPDVDLSKLTIPGK